MEIHDKQSCAQTRRALQDTLEAINGKWKILILITLMDQPYRFKDLSREVGITPRMLSKELQDLEMNRLISRTVRETKPVMVEYAVTEYGRTLQGVLSEMASWGITHRKTIMV